MAELCKSWPKRWDEYVQPVLWLQRTKPLPWLPGSPTHFKLLLGRHVRSQIDAGAPELDGSDFLQHGGLHDFVADRKEAWRGVTKVRDALLKRHEIRQHKRSRRNAGIQNASAGTKVKRGDLVMVQVADSTLWHEGVHRKFVRENWTGPWKVSTIITSGLCYHSSSTVDKSEKGGQQQHTSSLFTPGPRGYHTISATNTPTSLGTRTWGSPPCRQWHPRYTPLWIARPQQGNVKFGVGSNRDGS